MSNFNAFPLPPTTAGYVVPEVSRGDLGDKPLITRGQIEKFNQQSVAAESTNLHISKNMRGAGRQYASAAEPEQVGGPFYPEVYRGNDDLWEDDKIIVGRNEQLFRDPSRSEAESAREPPVIHGRSANLPAFVFVAGCKGYFPTQDVVSLWTFGEDTFEDLPTSYPYAFTNPGDNADHNYRVLCAKIVVNSSVESAHNTLNVTYVFLSYRDIRIGLRNWMRYSDYYFPLCWVHVHKQTLTVDGTSHVVKRVVETKWRYTGTSLAMGNTDNQRAVPITITSGTGERHIGNVYANGYDRDPTATGQVVRITSLADSTYSIPVGTQLVGARVFEQDSLEGGDDTYKNVYYTYVDRVY